MQTLRGIEALSYEFSAKVAQRGKITIPSTIREILGIKDGDIVTLNILEVAKKEKG